jgi:hypothetical protein
MLHLASDSIVHASRNGQRGIVNFQQFEQLIGELTELIQGRPLDEHLEAYLNETVPPSGAAFQRIFAACEQGIADGWMCRRESTGIRYGRVLKPTAQTHGFSVDVVEMTDVVGPHHAHPNGEIDMVMPIDSGAEFDSHKAGWVVYRPNSAHNPTVTGGRALVLYLLPQGAIDFSASAE